MVERHMRRFLQSLTVPGKADCERCLLAEAEALKERDWKSIKFYVYNRISASRRRRRSQPE